MRLFAKASVALSFCVALLCGPLTASAYTKSGTIYTTNGSHADVSAAVADAGARDTVTVPAGSFTWAAPLVITKGITLAGAGASLTSITSAYAGSWLIVYRPSNYSLNTPFRITGFTFDFARKSGGIILEYSSSDLTVQTNVRIDHNTLKNAVNQALMINGMRGVVDNNAITGTEYPIRFASGEDQRWWDSWEGLVFGGADGNMYIEDNLIESTGTVADCQFGNRYAFRYNVIVSSSPEGAYPLFDMHGNAGQYWSCFGGEIYGNDITVQGHGGYILDQRGGKSAVYYNRVNGRNVGIKTREEVCDASHPTTNPQPQHVSDSYNWANYRTGGYPLTAYESDNSCSTYQVKENKDWWNFNPLYDGTTPGVGCGTTLPDACTPGDGFWMTTQSCTDLNGLVGREPTTPISGRLYKCTAARRWEAYFTPFPYPHPLRGPSSPRHLVIRK